MKTLILILACSLCFWLFNTKTGHSVKVKNMASAATDSINFQSQLQPVFQKKCSPCHFPGGKMYEKMPFDKGETIIAHETGILKRIKDEREVSLIKKFVEQNKSVK